jgi:hypothetical protein
MINPSAVDAFVPRQKALICKWVNVCGIFVKIKPVVEPDNTPLVAIGYIDIYWLTVLTP